MRALVKKLSIVISVILTVAVSQQSTAQEFKKITRLGTSQTVCKDGVYTPEQLQAYFANNPEVIEQILLDSGWAGKAADLFAAVAAGEFAEVAYPTGTRLAWMGAKVKGQYVANPYREWAGSKSMEAYQINVKSGDYVFELAVPKICCNLSLVSVKSVPQVVAASADEIAPIAVKESALGLSPFFAAFAGTETRPRYEPAWDMDMHDSSGIVGVRAGVLKPISERTSLLGQVSYYDRTGVNSGNIYPEDNFSIDIGLERMLSDNAFIGGGVGIWNVDDSDFRDASLFAHLGGNLGASAFQWFLEGRVFDSDSKTHDSLSDNKMFSGGIRYLVK